jgi:hypothetical protein
MNPDSRSPTGLGSSILEQSPRESATAVATSQLLIGRFGLDQDAIGNLLEHDVRPGRQPLALAQPLRNHDLTLGSYPVSHT